MRRMTRDWDRRRREEKGGANMQCCGAGAGGAEIIWDLEPEPKLDIFCSQFGGCYDEDKLISTSISIVLLF